MECLIKLLDLCYVPLIETVYMVVVSTVFAFVLGLPLGMLLVVTDKNHICENARINKFLNFAINITRSIPFIILIILIFPLSRFIVGTTIGSGAAIVPLSIGATPLVARIIETSLKEVDFGVINACIAMGANKFEIMFRVMMLEAMPSLVLGITMTIINIIGYSAMAGAIGGGGLGDLAIRYGYQRFQTDVLITTIIILIVMVEIVQGSGNLISKKLNKR